ncbi:MAG TPA: acyltransferase [Pseudogracilibacillus sp.]|nr:acyltransferase [Pseudogracilibacillus sp.]
MIKEWDFVRVVASLSIVLLHSTTRIAKINQHVENDIYQFIRVLLTASTAVFILLSIIIIAYIYKDRIPDDFIRKRFKYIFFPFLFFAIVYAYYNGVITGSDGFYQKLLNNFKGNYVGWFILPILQLYIVFWLLKKFKLDKNTIIIGLMGIGLFYLWALNNGQSSGFFINLKLQVLFPLWLIYFGIAYFIGSYYNSFSQLLKTKKSIFIIFGLLLLSLILIKYNFDNGNRSVNSRRLDLVPYVTMLTILLLYAGKKIPHLFIIRYLSKYAFGIYLIHWLIQQIIAPYFADLNGSFLQVFGLFFTSLIFSIFIIRLISLIPFSEFMIGNIKNIPSISNLIIDKLDLLFKEKKLR